MENQIMIKAARVGIVASLLSMSLASTASCRSAPSVTPSPTVTYTQYQLEYNLFTRYADIFWCDPDYYPVARSGGEQANAEAQFAAIRANTAEFSAILEQLTLPNKPEYTADEKLLIYREHKELTYGAQMAANGSGYNYTLRIGKNSGSQIQGTISVGGTITETKREASFNT
jgi:hypothetical protein